MGLVEDHDGGVTDGAWPAEALAHAQRHLAGQEVGDVADADDLEHPVDRTPTAGRCPAATTRR